MRDFALESSFLSNRKLHVAINLQNIKKVGHRYLSRKKNIIITCDYKIDFKTDVIVGFDLTVIPCAFNRDRNILFELKRLHNSFSVLILHSFSRS